ncbi:MAG: PilZ domain-containing protein, partial [Oscillospiraceae bacterium]|nr:PilZ domain-containing protein [Oscillospiraceae bacterium]
MADASGKVEIYDFFSEKIADGTTFDYPNEKILIDVEKFLAQPIINKRVLVKITTPLTKVTEKFEAKVLAIKKESITILLLKKLNPKDLRRYFQIKTNIKTQILHFMDNDNNRIYPNGIPIKIKDLSAGGIYFTAIEQFRVGTRFVFSLMIERTPLVISAKILRAEEHDGECGYGCSFVG